MRNLIVPILGLVVLFAGTAAAAPFTFPDAEFLPDDRGLQRAQDFVKNDLPAGLAMNAAVARVQRAHARCRHPAGQAAVVCVYFIESHLPDGDSGENIWTVRLVPGPDGTLQSASVTRSHSGL